MDRKRLNFILWPVALLLLNSLWAGISDNSAPYEVNDFDHPIEVRIIPLAGVFGQEKPMPAEFEVEFKSLSVEEGEVAWQIFDSSDTVVAQWSGNLGDDDAGWSGDLSPGTYRVETTVDQGILTEQTLFIQPFGAYVFEGHIALSLLLIGVAFAETFARKKGSEYLENKKSNSEPVKEKAPFARPMSGMPEHDTLPNEDDPWRTPKGL